MYKIQVGPTTKDSAGYSSRLVTVQDNLGNAVGSYTYNHYRTPPFFPFKRNGSWYALYTTYPSKICVMSLPSCKKIAEVSDFNLCMAYEFYVPSYSIKDKSYVKNSGFLLTDPPGVSPEDLEFVDFGFVSGYFSGASGVYMYHLDLSKLEEGIIIFSSRFGDLEMPNNTDSLAECIDIELLMENGRVIPWWAITVTTVRSFELSTGLCLEDSNYPGPPWVRNIVDEECI